MKKTMIAIDGKSLLVGLLVGVCLCTVVFLVHKTTNPAVAAVAAKQPPRYQFVLNQTSRGQEYYLVEQNTGAIYWGRLGRHKYVGPVGGGWQKFKDGPTGQEVLERKRP